MAKIIPLPRATKGGPPRFPDADLVVVLLLLAPLCLGVVVHTILRGEAFGVQATVCAGIAVLAIVAAAYAWRGRRSPRPGGGSLTRLIRRERGDRRDRERTPSSFSAK
jgi:hypothetical protein